MNPVYIKNFINDANQSILIHLRDDIKWLEVTEARKEYFMSSVPRSYTYGQGRGIRTYESRLYTLPVYEILSKLNKQFNCTYNVCHLNRYDEPKHALNYHADDSPEMNPAHPIAVISFGALREIWWKNKNDKGEVPAEQKQWLEAGSLFIMPPGFQKNYVHKIPRAGYNCGMRISLTFRNWL